MLTVVWKKFTSKDSLESHPFGIRTISWWHFISYSWVIIGVWAYWL